jgi:hypothetical protein
MIEDEGVSLAELKADACRWPVAMGTDGEWRFCAAPIDKAAAGRFPGGVSYCSEHLARAYATGRPVRKNWIERPVEIEHAGGDEARANLTISRRKRNSTALRNTRSRARRRGRPEGRAPQGAKGIDAERPQAVDLGCRAIDGEARHASRYLAARPAFALRRDIIRDDTVDALFADPLGDERQAAPPLSKSRGPKAAASRWIPPWWRWSRPVCGEGSG